MNRRREIGIFLLIVAVAARAEEPFSKTVPPQDFSAAGLAKLTPTELARLDALVRARLEAQAREFSRRASSAPQHEVSDALAAQASALVPATPATEKKTAAGWLANLKGKSRPDNKPEPDTVTSRIAGRFTGWEGRVVVTLENGQRWQTIEAGTNYCPPVQNPQVTTIKGALGSYWMTIVEAGIHVRVQPATGNE